MGGVPIVGKTGGYLPHPHGRDRDSPAHRRSLQGSQAAVVARWKTDRVLFGPERQVPDLDHPSRRLLFAGRGKLYIMDVASKRLREVLSAPSNNIQGPALSRDNRLIVFLMPVTEADVWLATLQ
jgi:hypothetical protein